MTEKLGSVDTEQLGEGAKKSLTERIHAAKFFQLPERLPEGEVGADLYTYRVTVADGAKRHSVSFRGEKDRAGLHDLIKAVTG